MNSSRRWLLYSLLRLGLFAGIFAILMLLGLWWWASAIFAMLLSFLISYLLLRDTRDQLALDLQERRKRAAEDPDSLDPDAEAENAANDEARGS